MINDIIYYFIMLCISIFFIYNIKFLFTFKRKIIHNRKDFIEYFKNMLSNLNGNNFILSDSILDPYIYNDVYDSLNNLLLYNTNNKLTIYFGSTIGLEDKYKSKINSNGNLIIDYLDELKDIHPILKLKFKYNNQIILKVINDESYNDFFFFSEDDKVAWKKEPYNHFDDTITYFKKNLDLNNIEHMNNLIFKCEKKSKEISLLNINDLKYNFKLKDI